MDLATEAFRIADQYGEVRDILNQLLWFSEHPPFLPAAIEYLKEYIDANGMG
jgi:hypothetical protein